MKTKILKDYEYERFTVGEIFESKLIGWIDSFGLYAIELIGKDEPEKIKGLFGDMVDVPENIIRNIFRKELREKLRKELFE